MRSGRGVGKTATAALITHWWLATRNPGLVVASAGTWSHLEDKLWPEINAWGKAWGLKSFFEYQTMAIYRNGKRETWKAVAASSDRAVNVEGYHNPNFLLLIDEAKGMPDEIFAALIASLSGDENMGSQKCVALSTPPTSEVGWFAERCSSERWKTVHVSGLDSPRVSKEYVEDIAETFGEQSPEYQAYVLGDIPEGKVGQLIRAKWVRDAQLYRGARRHRPVVTCDVARGGDDLCVIGVIENGAFDLVWYDEKEMKGPARFGWWSESDLMVVVKYICLAVMKHKPSAVCIDDTGLGGGVTDRLRELQVDRAFPASCAIWPVNFGTKPRRRDRFFIQKDEIWWSARETLRSGAIGLPSDHRIREWRLPRGTNFKKQLLAPIYESDLRERIRVYDKRMTGKEITKALPVKSPDLAHAFILGVDYYQRQEELTVPVEPPKTQEEALARVMQENVEQLLQQNRMPRTPFQR